MRPLRPIFKAFTHPFLAVHQAVLASGTIAAVLLGSAAGSVGSIAKEIVGGTTITVGESNTEAQRGELLEFFGASSDAQVIEVTVSETNDAMGGVFGDQVIQSAYSSTSFTCRDLGDGLEVATRNIEVVTPAVFALALVTAGIGDGTLVVAAPSDSPAQGMTALTGVFRTWEVAPCDTGQTNPARQRLALEEISLVATIGKRLVAEGIADGITRSSDTVLETQKTIINERLRDVDAIDVALAEQERIHQVRIPAAERAQLVKLFLRLAISAIDWSTFSNGWTIDYTGARSITMRGDGIAIRNAQASATALAAQNDEAAAAAAAAEQAAAATEQAAAAATAQARVVSRAATAAAKESASLTATAEAQALLNATATAQAQAAAAAAAAQQANVDATASAVAAITATASSQPTMTPVPTPTPVPSSVNGSIVASSPSEVVVRADGNNARPEAYALDASASITRDGVAVDPAGLVVGDLVSLTVAGGSQKVTELVASQPPVSILSRLIGLSWLLPIGLAAPAFFWAKGRGPTEPFVLRRLTP